MKMPLIFRLIRMASSLLIYNNVVLRVARRFLGKDWERNELSGCPPYTSLSRRQVSLSVVFCNLHLFSYVNAITLGQFEK